MATLPRFVVFGGDPPAVLAEALYGAAELVPAGTIPDAEADALVLYDADGALDALRAFRGAGGALPVYGWSARAVDLERRLLWLREGADDLVGGHVGAARLRERLARADDTRVASDPQRVDAWLERLPRYLRARAQLWTGVDADVSERHAEAMRLRDALLGARDPALEPLPDPIVPTAVTVEVSGATMALTALGAEGLAVRGTGVVLLPIGSSVRVVVEGQRLRGHVSAEVRWSRPGPGGVCDLGLYALRCEARPRHGDQAR